MSSEDSTKLILLGRELGMHSGWDESDVDALMFYDFVPFQNIPIAATSCLFVNFSTGVYECYSDDGESVTEKGDLISALKDMRQAV